MTLTDFLLARLAEEDLLTVWAGKVAADVRAGVSEDIERALAAPWSGHPDFRSEWSL